MANKTNEPPIVCVKKQQIVIQNPVEAGLSQGKTDRSAATQDTTNVEDADLQYNCSPIVGKLEFHAKQWIAPYSAPTREKVQNMGLNSASSQ